MKKFPGTKKRNGERKRSKQRVDWVLSSYQFTLGSQGTCSSDLSRLEFFFEPTRENVKLFVSEARKKLRWKSKKGRTGCDSSGVQIAVTVCHVRQRIFVKFTILVHATEVDARKDGQIQAGFNLYIDRSDKPMVAASFWSIKSLT